jgi:hypothetical protein
MIARRQRGAANVRPRMPSILLVLRISRQTKHKLCVFLRINTRYMKRACKAHESFPSSLDPSHRILKFRLITLIMSDLRPATIAVNLTLIVLTSLAISCRIGRKVKILSTFGWHDGMFSPLIVSLIKLTDMKHSLPLLGLAPSSCQSSRCTPHVSELVYTKKTSIQTTWRCFSRYVTLKPPSPAY